MEHLFVGRKQEMERLESLYARPGLNTCAVFGRRQTGKSTLLAEFSKNKRTVFLQFSRKAVNCKVLDDLEAKTENTPSIPNLRYIIVAVSGFDTELEDAMENGRVILVGTDKLLGRVPPDDLESFPMRGLELIG